jgi:hypothetical protein
MRYIHAAASLAGLFTFFQLMALSLHRSLYENALTGAVPTQFGLMTALVLM